MKSLLHSAVSKTQLLAVILCSLIGSVAMAQSESDEPFFVGTMNIAPVNHPAHSAQGYLLVYSATDPVDDGDLVFNVHSSYSVYTPDGKLFKNVDNHISRSDEIPELVSLPVGSYIVRARSANDGYIGLRVVIKPGQRTTLTLDD